MCEVYKKKVKRKKKRVNKGYSSGKYDLSGLVTKLVGIGSGLFVSALVYRLVLWSVLSDMG